MAKGKGRRIRDKCVGGRGGVCPDASPVREGLSRGARQPGCGGVGGGGEAGGVGVDVGVGDYVSEGPTGHVLCSAIVVEQDVFAFGVPARRVVLDVLDADVRGWLGRVGGRGCGFGFLDVGQVDPGR